MISQSSGTVSLLLLLSLLICDGPTLSFSDDSPPDCPYPCLLPPKSMTSYPPPPESIFGYPPPPPAESTFGYPPPPPSSGYVPNYYSPPSYILPAPPPPDPILPYFPFYYRKSSAVRSSTFTGATLLPLLVVSLLGILLPN